MGRRLVLPSPRAGWAAASIAAAALLPLVAWWISGGRAVEREAARLRVEARDRSVAAARRDADAWAARLERLRIEESRRPWYVYQPLYHDPEGVSQGIALQRSPLAVGPRDPAVASYFQVGADGRLELPDDVGEPRSPASPPPDAAARLEPARRDLVAWLAKAAPRTVKAPSPSRAGTTGSPPDEARSEAIDRSAYRQNAMAQQLYLQLKAAPGSAAAPSPGGRVVVETGGFGWRTLPTAGGPVLAAVRRVRTPEGTRAQGFVVAAEALTGARAGGGTTSALVPGTGHGPRVGDTGWEARVDDGAAVAEAAARGAALASSFRRQLGLGALAALTAAGFAVALVLQFDRVARERSRFAAAAAHELRTPLAGLRLYGDLLSEAAPDSERARGYARSIAAESERLGRVVANVLGYTRLERGRMSVRAEPGDLVVAARDAVDRQRAFLEAAGCDVRFEADAGVPAACFDRDALDQIVQNLLDNAERHTRDAASRAIEVRVESRERRVALAVRDRGPGVAPERRRSLFDGARAAGAAGTTAGLGLGLPLTASLARAQGGDVAYDEPAGGGARFVVTFPRA